jgi:hypothetical protein
MDYDERFRREMMETDIPDLASITVHARGARRQ